MVEREHLSMWALLLGECWKTPKNAKKIQKKSKKNIIIYTTSFFHSVYFELLYKFLLPDTSILCTYELNINRVLYKKYVSRTSTFKWSLMIMVLKKESYYDKFWFFITLKRQQKFTIC